MDNLFETLMNENTFDLGPKTFGTDSGYYGSEVVAVYEQVAAPGLKRKKRESSNLIAEVEIAFKDGALTAELIDQVYTSGTSSGDVTISGDEPAATATCR